MKRQRYEGVKDSLIAIVDYCAGNLRSVELAFKRVGAQTVVTGDADMIGAASGVVLPGVGAFADAMGALSARGLISPILKTIDEGRPFLGICLGMQALFDSSEEGGGVAGLGVIPGQVKRLSGQGMKVPHVGWNSFRASKDSELLRGLPEQPYAYFVHSYACRADNGADVLAVTEYGVPFHAAVQRRNVTGVQFHPEKSGVCGEAILKNFIKSIP